MTDQATRVVPAGWYQDPALPEQVRWWNGLVWTEHVREKPVVASAVTATATAEDAAESTTQSTADRIAAARELERQFGVGTSENEIVTSATALGYGVASSGSAGSGTAGSGTALVVAAPATTTANAAESGAAGRLATVRPATVRPATGRRVAARTATGSSWLIALTPLLTLVLGIAAAYIYFYVATTPLVFVAAFLLPYLLGIIWAISDGRTLRSRGFTPPSPLWALLGSIGYLIARRVRVSGSGPLVMFLVVGVLVLAAPGVAYASGALRPLSTALTIQNTISQDYVSTGRAASVNCPPFVDATVTGTLYTCNATLATGVVKTVWVSIDDDDGRFSYAMAI